MLKTLLGISPQAEPDGSYRPSKLAMKLATSAVTDYEPVPQGTVSGHGARVLVVVTERKDMTMHNGKRFSTGTHPVELLVPLLHLRSAGLEIEISTPTGAPAAIEMWAMPTKDEAVMGLYEALKPQLEAPLSLSQVVEGLPSRTDTRAVYLPGGHGAMLGLPEDENLGRLLRWAHEKNVYTVALCHGPGALLATAAGDSPFLYEGYKMAVFPDSVDKMTPKIGYLPGAMPWHLGAKLAGLGVNVVNTKADDTCCVDRLLITGASPEASQKLGVLVTKTILDSSAAG